MAELKKFYRETVVKKLMEELGYKNPNQVPTIKNVVVNVGIASSNKDNGFIDTIETNLKRITGQKPVKTLAKKAISNFKIRQGMVVGMKVTMRGQRMWDFVE
jgi:large subunit ribosomal protein L5